MGRPKGSTDAPERLVQASLRGFRRHGFGGVGVDALSAEAGLTSGALYAHLGSKAEAFRQSIGAGLAMLRDAVSAYQQEFGRDWLARFADYYLDELVEAEAAEACLMPTLTSDVARADEATRIEYGRGIDTLLAQLAAGLAGTRARARGSAILAMLTGASAIARALPDPAERRAYRLAVAPQLLAMARPLKSKPRAATAPLPGNRRSRSASKTDSKKGNS